MVNIDMLDTTFYYSRPKSLDKKVAGSAELEGVLKKISADRKHYRDLYVCAKDIQVAYVHTQSKHPWGSYKIKHDGNTYALREHSWRQLTSLGVTGLHKKYVETMWKQTPQQFADVMSAGFRVVGESLLIRLTSKLTKDERGVEGAVRAILPSNYNRFDNLYLVQGLMRCDVFHHYQPKNFIYTEDHLEIDFILPGSFPLHNDGDEAVTGLRVVNYEIDAKHKCTVSLYFERLICTNGMKTSRTDDIRAPATLVRETDYPDGLPPSELTKKTNGDIDNFLREAADKIESVCHAQRIKLQEHIRKLRETPIQIASKRDTAAYIRNMLDVGNVKRSQLAYFLGVPSARVGDVEDEIYQAYLAECAESPDTDGTALVLYNALTRYVSTIGNVEEDADTNRNYRIRFADELLTRSHVFLESPSEWTKIRNLPLVKPDASPQI